MMLETPVDLGSAACCESGGGARVYAGVGGVLLAGAEVGGWLFGRGGLGAVALTHAAAVLSVALDRHAWHLRGSIGQMDSSA